jgi:ribonuclease BN (tRNA processing enzyme)
MSREAATRSSWRARPSCALLLCILFFCVLAQPALATTPPAPAPLEMVVLGSGGPGASARAGAAYVLLMDGEPRILVDAGPGSLVRLGEAKLDIRQLDTVLLTHLHADHAAELPGIVKARAVSARTDIGFHVFGPAGAQGDGDVAARFPSTSGFVERLFGKSGAFAYLADFAGTIDFTTSDLFPLGDSDPSREPRVIHRIGDLVISAVAGHHRDAPAVIYRVDYKGKRITFSGDIDAQGHAALTRIAKDADLLVFNAVVLDPPDSPPALYALHTSPGDIGRIAGAAGVKAVLLSHLSASVDESRERVSRSIQAHYAGRVQFAQDGMRIEP